MQDDRQDRVEIAIRVRDLVVAFDETNVLDHLSLDVVKGEILGLVGGSGSGKSVLMRTIIGLLPKRRGSIEVLGVDLDKATSAEASGGMTQRAALARALALDPEIVFLDEPTSGLDPIAAGDFDMLIRTLQRTLGLTVFMVTHDLESLATVCDGVAVLAEGKVV